MHTAAAARAAAPMLGPDTHVLTLQNGLGNAEAIAAEVGAQRVLAGVTYDSAVTLGKGHVRLANAGAALIGRFDGDARGVPEPVLAAIAEAGIEASSTDDVEGLIWGKALVNSVFNATCAITSYRSGEIGEHEAAREFAGAVARETAAVAAALGVRLPYDDPVAKVLDVAAGAGQAKASMLQDVEAGRRTEVDQINGAIAAAGERVGVPAPLNRALTLLVHMVEERAEAARA
jgi:2-dehydropantoate 2-reductase